MSDLICHLLVVVKKKRIKTNFSLQSNAKRDPTEEEKEDCIQPCEKEKEQLSQGNKQRWETEFYQYTMDYNNEKIFDDCTDFCIARSRYSKIWEQNHHYTQFDLD